jgi:hypothetical protein
MGFQGVNVCVCRWTVEAGAAALEAEGFVLGDQGTAAAAHQPELPAGASASAKAAATGAWQQQNAQLLVQVSTQPCTRMMPGWWLRMHAACHSPQGT